MGALRFADVAVVIAAAPFVLLMSAPVLGYAVGGAAWIVQRFAGDAIDGRLTHAGDARKALTLGLVSSLGRIWFLALTILVVGKAGARADGLTAALVVLAAFTVHFSMKLVAQRSHRGGPQPS